MASKRKREEKDILLLGDQSALLFGVTRVHLGTIAPPLWAIGFSLYLDSVYYLFDFVIILLTPLLFRAIVNLLSAAVRN